MSKVINKKISELQAQRTELEKKLEFQYGQRQGLRLAIQPAKTHLNGLEHELRICEEKLDDLKSAHLIATAQLEFVKECIEESRTAEEAVDTEADSEQQAD